MLATEIKRILKDGAVIVIVLAAIFAGIIFSDQDAYLAPALELFLLLYASFTGWSLFERERQENATEYMLSLPLSRNRLLLQKFLPRLLGVSLILLIYLHLHRSWQLPSSLSPVDFSVLYAGFVLLAIAFSISFKNFISAFFTTCLLSVGQVLLIMLLDEGREIGRAILQASLTVLVFPLFFFFLFQRYDIKPLSYFNKKFFPGLLLLTVLITGVLFLTAPPNWANMYLTRKGMLIKNSCKLSEIVMKDRRRRLNVCLFALRETADGNALFAMTRKPKPKSECIATSLVTLDMKTGDLKTLFPIDADWSIAGGYLGEIGIIRNGTFSLFLQNFKLKKAMVVQVRNGQVLKFPVAGNFYDENIEYIFYLDKTPPQLVIYSKPRLYRLDISGQVKELAKTESLDVWQDKILLFEPPGMSLYRVGEELTLLRQWQGNFKKCQRRMANYKFGYESRGIIFHADRNYFWLDMELQKEKKLELKSLPFTYQQSGDDFNAVLANGPAYTIMEMRSGKQREKKWDPGFTPRYIRISPFGVLAFYRQKTAVYPFKTN
jgi:hypothetical protein